jgi:hypothetical protein
VGPKQSPTQKLGVFSSAGSSRLRAVGAEATKEAKEAYHPVCPPHILHLLEAAFGKPTQETGYATDGQSCV